MERRIKSIFQKQKIKQLRGRIEELEQENESLLKEIEENKRILLLKEKSFGEKESQLDSLKKTYTELIADLKEKREQLTNIFRDAITTKEKYEREIKKELDRIRKQK